MTKKEKPKPIGTCPCPESECAEVIEVRKYQERSGRGSMFKGKFYGNCPAHGRVIDANRPASQEHVLERGYIWGAKACQVSVQTEEICKTTQPALEPAPAPKAEPAAVVKPAQQPILSMEWTGWNLWDWWPTKPG